MYTRALAAPNRSFFLFGPRATGKTTWLKESLDGATWFNLLLTRTMIELAQNPDLLRQKVEALPAKSWIIVDEVQRMPNLLNEVHALLLEHQDKYRFALTGSSARKLKRAKSNLLAGRAINRKFFPLTGMEMNYDFIDTDELLKFGCLPGVRNEKNEKHRIDVLEAYVENYIREEIKEEAVVKNLDGFVRFLEIAGLINGEVCNTASTARDAGIARTTVEGYFEVLVDTLTGFRLPAWRPRAKVKEVEHPKNYLFDCGVVRALTGRLRDPLDSAERGKLFETLVLNELRAWSHYHESGGELFYWRTPSGGEIDFIWKRGKHAIGFEVKSTPQWKTDYSRSLRELHDARVIQKCFGVYDGKDQLKDGAVVVLPLRQFMKTVATADAVFANF